MKHVYHYNRRCYEILLLSTASGWPSGSRARLPCGRSRSGHTKDHHKNGTNCLPEWHAMRYGSTNKFSRHVQL